MTEHTRPSDDASSRDSSPLSLQLSHNSDIHSDRASAKSCGHNSKISGLEEGNGDMRASTVASTLDASEECMNGGFYHVYIVLIDISQ